MEKTSSSKQEGDILNMANHLFSAFLLTAIAGFSTGIGSLIAFFTKSTNKQFLSISLGFSAGVMIYVSMIEIFPEANGILQKQLGDKLGTWATVLAFFGGMLFIAIIDKLIPSEDNPHEFHNMATPVPEKRPRPQRQQKLMRIGIKTALALAIHNFPEGLATFVSAMQDPRVAIPIVIAIAIHNIPEGIAVSVPIYQATGSRKLAFQYSFLSGLAEPIGALVGWFILMPVMNDIVYGVIFASVAGIMVFISLDELLPAAREYGEHPSLSTGLFQVCS